MQNEIKLGEEYLDQLLTETETAEVLSFSVYALRNWRVRGGGPKFVKVSQRSVRYRRRDLNSWAIKLLKNNTSE